MRTMSYAAALSLGREAIFTALIVAAPMLLLGLLTGLLVSIFQAVTQIQEQTLTFIPKILVSALAILFFGPFMLAMLTSFTTRVFTSIPQFIR
jgi:flagellar biosynthetic protein FliQ